MAQHILTGSTIEWQVSASFTAIGQLISLGDVEVVTEPVEGTLLSDRHMRWLPGTVTDCGEQEFVVAFDPETAQHLALLNLVDAATYPISQTFRVTYPTTTPTVWERSGLVYKASIGGAESNGKWTATFTLRYNEFPGA